jgi:histidinol dehydrogenase
MNDAMSIFDTSKMTEAEINQLFNRAEVDLTPYLEKVRPIVDSVQKQGDKALIKYTQAFDQANLEQIGLQVTEEEIDKSAELLDKDLIDSIKYAIKNITTFHQSQMPEKNVV